MNGENETPQGGSLPKNPPTLTLIPGGNGGLPSPRQRIDKLHGDKRIREPYRIVQIAGIIEQVETANGGFLCWGLDNICYLFNGPTRRLYPLLQGAKGGVNTLLGHHFDQSYGLLYTEKLTRHVVCKLETAARNNPARPAVQRFAFYDTAKRVLYLSQYNGSVWRLDGKKVITIPNGSEVLFLDDDPHVHPIQADIANHNLLRKTLINDITFDGRTDKGLNPNSQRLILETYFYALPFAEHLYVKPILVLEGEQGSGKTLALQRLQLMLFGGEDTCNVNDQTTVEDLMVILQRRKLLLLDNLDGMQKWIPNFIANYVTGGKLIKRRRYTDMEENSLNPNTFIAVTSRDPRSLVRDDVASRLLLLRVKNRNKAVRGGGNCDLVSTLFSNVLRARPQLLGEYLYKLNLLVAALQQPKDNVLYSRAKQHRLADFALFMYTAAPILGYTSKLVTDTLFCAQVEREALLIENDAISDLLTLWLDLPKIKTQPVVAMTGGQLFQALFAIGEQYHMRLRYQSAKALARYLKDNERSLAAHFGLTREDDTHNHQVIYVFRPPASAGLGSQANSKIYLGYPQPKTSPSA